MKPAKTFKNMREKAEHQGLIFTMPKIKKAKRTSAKTEQKQAEQTRPKPTPKYNKINIFK